RVEVVVREEGVDDGGEFGIAANFRESQAGRTGRPAAPEQLAWLRRVADWQQTVDDAAKFLDALRCEIGYTQIRVFTTTGDAVSLPEGATPVDFAYTVDASLGNACIGASINGRLAPLSSRLDDGDVVDIITRGPEERGLDERGPGERPGTVARSPAARGNGAGAQTNVDESSVGGTEGAGPAREWLDFVRSP